MLKKIIATLFLASFGLSALAQSTTTPVIDVRSCVASQKELREQLTQDAKKDENESIVKSRLVRDANILTIKKNRDAALSSTTTLNGSAKRALEKQARDVYRDSAKKILATYQLSRRTAIENYRIAYKNAWIAYQAGAKQCKTH